MSAGPKIVLLALCDFADQHDKCCPTVAMISQCCGIAERTTQQHLCRLERAGYIARSVRPGAVTQYTITFPEEVL